MRIYLDNATTTKLDPLVLKAMTPYFTEEYGAPSSEFGHSFGVEAREAIENARKIIAEKLNADPKEIIFTSGEAESNNFAIKGYIYANKNKKNHLITSKIEGFSVLNIFKQLEKEGFKVTYLNVDKEGFIDLNQLKSSITKNTLIVSISHANGEIGTIQNIEEISKICKEKGIIFHTNAAHSFTIVPINVKASNIDLLSVSAHKIHGPKGIGALFVKKGIKLKKLIDGGYQENNKRAGTENTPSIVGFAKAVELTNNSQLKHMSKLRDKLINKILSEIPHTQLNGPIEDKRLCNNVNINFNYVEGESMLLNLDMEGIAVTTGSACASRMLEVSHTLLALGIKHEIAHGSIRMSLSRFNTKEEINYTIKVLKKVVERLRSMSPLMKR